MRRRRILLPLLLAGLLMALASGAALGKGHVPAGQVQVSHKGRTAINVDAPALQAHIGHGDIQLPACDFANSFMPGDDTSNVLISDFTGVTYSDVGFVARSTTTSPAGAASGNL